jgi:hypothetical protein
MRRGYFYQHDLAPDMYIDVLKTYQIKPEVWLIKCRVFTHASPMPWETTRFRITHDKLKYWHPIVPR